MGAVVDVGVVWAVVVVWAEVVVSSEVSGSALIPPLVRVEYLWVGAGVGVVVIWAGVVEVVGWATLPFSGEDFLPGGLPFLGLGGPAGVGVGLGATIAFFVFDFFFKKCK